MFAPCCIELLKKEFRKLQHNVDIDILRENRTLKRLQPRGGVWGGVVPFPCVVVVAPSKRARARTTRGRGLAVGVGVDGCPET